MQLLGFSLLCIIWGTTWLAIKTSVQGFPPFYGAGVRFLLALIVLLFVIWFKKIPLRLDKREFWLLVINAFLIYTLDYGLIYWAEQHLTAGVTAIFFAPFTLFTAIWSNFFFRSESFRWHKSIGLLIGFSGILIVFYDQLAITQFNRLITLAATAVIISAAGGAISAVVIKKYLTTMNPYKLTFHQMWMGVIQLFLLGFIFEDFSTIKMSQNIISAIVYLSLLGTVFAFVVYYTLLQKMSAITLSLIVYITPIVALIADYLAFGEVIPLRSLIGMMFIFSGIGVTQAKIKKYQTA